MMNQSLLLCLVLLSLSFLVAPIHARGKSHPEKTPSPSPIGTPAPGPSKSDCSQVIYSMLDCLQYLTPGSNDTKPGKSCCVGIETVLEYNPQCICAGLVMSSQMDVALNNTRALATPKACNLPIAPPHCGILTPSTTTPVASVPVKSPVTPSAGRPKALPNAAKPPASSQSLAKPPSVTAPPPLTSGTNNLLVPTLTVVAVTVFSLVYISAFLINCNF